MRRVVFQKKVVYWVGGSCNYFFNGIFFGFQHVFKDDERPPSCRGAEERQVHEGMNCHYGDDVGNFLAQPDAEATVSGKLL